MNDIEAISAPAPLAAAAPPAWRIPLPSPCLFDRLEAAARLALEDELEWFSVPGGGLLFAAGDPADGLYLLLTGALGIVGERSGHGELLAQIHAGEAVVLRLGASRRLRMRSSPYCHSPFSSS